jgi:CubicO group peptidase (beta-lactamase class C family)
MTEFFEAGNSPGLSVSVGMNGEIAWSAGYGYADIEQMVPVDPAQTRFRIGSVIKPMTAFAAAQLVEAGKLDLDAAVQTYVPGFPLKPWPVTTRHLLGHLAGIRHYAGGEFFSREHYETVIAGLAIFQDDPLLHPPGETYRYSSYGYNLVGAVIEGASGEAFLDHLSAQVFEPLGMAHTEPDFLDRIISQRGRYYILEDGKVLNAPEVDNSYKWASGGVVGTSDDLVRFGLAQLDERGMSESIRNMFWTVQTTNSGEKTEYGLGWRIATDESGHLWIGHSGGSVGGTTTFWIRPDTGLVIAMISNLSDFDFGTVLITLAEVFVPEQQP